MTCCAARCLLRWLHGVPRLLRRFVVESSHLREFCFATRRHGTAGFRGLRRALHAWG